jgi:Trypsin-like peptidase domain
MEGSEKMRVSGALFVSCVALLAVTPLIRAGDITSDIISRVFLLKRGNSAGTCFAVEVDGRQYLVTAEHVMKGASLIDTVQIFRENRWNAIPVRVLFAESLGVDVAVLVPPVQLSSAALVDPTMDKLSLGQTMYLLGFPFTMRGEGSYLNAGFPIALVKSGICAGLVGGQQYMRIIVDALNNPGFSGGPIVFRDEWSGKLKVAGVISGFRYQVDTVYKCVDSPLVDTVATDLIFKSNTGLVIGTDIKSAMDIIRKNPIGPEVQK